MLIRYAGIEIKKEKKEIKTKAKQQKRMEEKIKEKIEVSEEKTFEALFDYVNKKEEEIEKIEKEINDSKVIFHEGEYKLFLEEEGRLENGGFVVHENIKTIEDVLNVLGIRGYEEWVMKGWKNGITYDGTYSALVNNEEEYFDRIKELTKLILHKISIGVYGYEAKCSSLLSLEEWHNMLESDLIDYELYDDEYINGESVTYIQPEYYFGDVKLKPRKEEYPCVLVLNAQGSIDDGDKFFWINI